MSKLAKVWNSPFFGVLPKPAIRPALAAGSPLAARATFTKQLPVLALGHCFATGSQWQCSNEVFGSRRTIAMPSLRGAEAALAGWTVENYRLEVEAEPLIAQLKNSKGPSHIVGHSYGGAVALHIAKRYPELVASLCLYEPAAFHLLRGSHEADLALLRDIEMLGRALGEAVQAECAEYAAQVFVDFWGGIGAWAAMATKQKDAVVDWIPKASLECGALINKTDASELPAEIPVTLMSGTRTHQHILRVIELLKTDVPHAQIVAVAEADHLAPLTRRVAVSDLVVRHIDKAETEQILN